MTGANASAIIVHAMKNHMSVSSVQAAACSMLSRLATNDENRKRIAEVGGVAVILDAMKRHASDANVQQHGCGALLKLSVRSDNLKLIKSAGGVSACFSAIVLHESVPAVQLPACGALASLVWRSDEIQELLGETGRGSVIGHAMQQFDFVVDLQSKGLAAAEQLQNETRKLIADDGRIAVVVDTMRLHASVAVVQEGCLGQQQKMLVGPEKNKMLVAAAVMDVQRQGCQALQELAFSDANEELIRVLGGISSIVTGMQQLEDVACIQDQGFCALARFLRDDQKYEIRKENTRLMLDAKAISVVVRAMQLHREDAKIQGSAFSFLSSLLWSDSDADDCLDAGLIGLIVCNMKHHRLVADVQAISCSVLQRLAYWNGMRRLIVQANGIAVVLDAMQQHESVVKVQKRACFALKGLAYGNAERQELIADAGGVSAILGAMQRHESDASLQLTACRTLGVFSELNAERQEVTADAGGVSAILGAMQRHELSFSVQWRACKALQNFIHGWKNDELMTRKIRESLTRTLRNFPHLRTAKKLQE